MTQKGTFGHCEEPSDEAISTLATDPKAGLSPLPAFAGTSLAVIQHKTPGFRLKAGMTKFVQFAQNAPVVIDGSIVGISMPVLRP